MKNFIFTWHKNERYGDAIIRKNKIVCDNPQDATAAFMRGFGNLKKNTIISIQEVDNNGNAIGEPITPME